jgi:hypothetical protein
MRSIFEAYVRGVWLHHCAEEDEIEAFKNDRPIKKFEDLIQAIEKTQGYDLGILFRLKKQAWKIMNSYTHSGFQHVLRRMTADTLEPNYCEDEIEEALACMNALGLLCVLEIAFLSTSEQLPMSVLEKTKEFVDGPSPEGVG